MTDFDPYAVLGLSPGADLAAVRRAYRRLARRCHPGLHPDAATTERFQLVEDAYRRLGESVGPRSNEVRWSAVRTVILLPRSATLRGARTADRDLVVEVGFGEAIRGTVVSMTLQRERPCLDCAGLDCQRCGGRGLQVSLERLRARIPAGVEDGARLRLVRRGRQVEDGEAAVTFLQVKVAEHPYFRRQGLDVFGDLPVTYPEATMGAEVDVPTVDGTVRVRIPPATPSGARFRLSGKGVRAEHGTGDHYYTVRIDVPQTLTNEERELLRRLPRRSPRENLPKTPVD